MNARQFIAYKIRCWFHGKAREDWYRRQIEADTFDRECVQKGRNR